MRRTIRSASTRMSLSLVAGASAIGSAIVLADSPLAVFGRPVPHLLGGALLVACAMSLGALFGQTIFGPRGPVQRIQSTVWRIVHFFSRRREG